MTISTQTSPKMSWDLRDGRPIPPIIHNDYCDMALKIREEFNDTIDQITKEKKFDLNWLMTSPACRNPLTSPLFHRLIILSLLSKNPRNIVAGIANITTDSGALAKVLSNLPAIKQHNIPIAVISQKTTRPNQLFFFLLHQLKIFFALRIFCKKSPLPNTPLILLDSFWSANYQGGDRYYGDILSFLPEKIRNVTYFVPHIIGAGKGQCIAIAKAINQETKKTLIKEHHLGMTDYYHALKFAHKSLHTTISEIRFGGTPIHELIQEEISEARNVRAIINAALNIRFAKRLKIKGIKLQLVVDWFENHEIDRGWNYGFNKYYPEIASKGYIGYPPLPLYTCSSPTKAERRGGILPKSFATSGPASDEAVKEFIPDMPVNRAPSFRYSHLFTPRENRTPKTGYSVLVILPLSIPLSKLIYKRLLGSLALFPKGTAIFLKPHPTFSAAKLTKKLAQQLPQNIHVVESDLPTLLASCNLAISSMSTSGLEVIVKRIPLITVRNNLGVTLSPIPEGFPESVHRLCSTQEEFDSAVSHFTRNNTTVPPEVAKEILDRYFTEPTKNTTQGFLKEL